MHCRNHEVYAEVRGKRQPMRVSPDALRPAPLPPRLKPTRSTHTKENRR